MARRSANEGTVYRHGDRWIAMLELPRHPDGRRRRGLRRARTKAEAQRLLRQMRDELHNSGGLGSATRTVGDAIETYRVDRPDSDHEQWALSLVSTGLGSIRLSTLTVLQCDEFLRTCSTGLGGRRPVGREQIRKVRQKLVAVLRNEVRTGNLSRNVADVSNLPVIEDSEAERRALDRIELARLFEAASGSRLILIDLCARNGLRPAEARGLRWSEINMDSRELTISGQQGRDNQRTAPKTPKAARTIQLDATTIGRLELWQDTQAELRLKANSAWQDLNIVASTSQGAAVDRHSLARSLRLLCKRANIYPAVSPYELRHTAISMQADAGRSSWEIADWAGTSETMVNRIYRHRIRRVSLILPVDDSPKAD